jgi:hypothetical protein
LCHNHTMVRAYARAVRSERFAEIAHPPGIKIK